MASHHIETTRAIFGPDMRVTLMDVSDNFFQALDEAFDGFRNHLLVSRFNFDEAWPTWEVHPEGDELVFLLNGDTDMVLATDDGEEVTRVNTPGEYVLVPKNTWHTARPHRPTSMLFLTPGEGTLNAAEPGGEPLF